MLYEDITTVADQSGTQQRGGMQIVVAARQAEHIVGIGHAVLGITARITSYNVCYTKLLREAPMSATQLVGEMEVLVPMAGLIDKDAELARLQKELDRLTGEIKRVEGKLANESYNFV